MGSLGGTLGRGCVWPPATRSAMWITACSWGRDIYWFRTRLFRFEDDALVQESAGYDWPALHLARLYSCQIRWSASGQPADLSPLLNVDVADHGGRADFYLTRRPPLPLDPAQRRLAIRRQQSGADPDPSGSLTRRAPPCAAGPPPLRRQVSASTEGHGRALWSDRGASESIACSNVAIEALAVIEHGESCHRRSG